MTERLRRLGQSTRTRLWLLTVFPTSLLFLAASFGIKYVVRLRIQALAGDSSLGAVELFDQAPTTEVILLATVVAAAISTVLTTGLVKRITERIAATARLAGEMAKGNYQVRTQITPTDTNMVRELAASVNALAESLERTERLRKELVASLAHEIRTPLTNLQGYLEAMRDGIIEPTEEALTSVHEEVMRLVRLVDALHQLARADALRQQPMDFYPTDLDMLVEQLVRVMRPAAEARGIRVFVDSGARRALMPIHADSIAQVLRNLLRNAVQYTNDGGMIRVQTGISQGVYRFTCLNSGPGIPQEDLPFIFNRFYRSGNPKPGKAPGVGIGLAIARELVEVHGGRIGADSKAGWTMVWFELPAEQGARLDVG